jgi:MFS family permease
MPGRWIRLLAIAPLAMGITSPLAGALSDRFGVRPLAVAGLTILWAAYAGLTFFGETTSPVGFVALWVPIGIGMGVFQSPNNSAILGAAPPQYAGVAGGPLTMTRLLGQLTGVAVLGSIWSARVGTHGQAGSPGSANAAAQVAGLHDIFTLAAVLMAAAVVLTIWSIRNEARGSTG